MWTGLSIKRSCEVSGNNIVADTSVLINFFNGTKPADEVLRDQHIWVSAISEIELLNYSALTSSQTTLIRSFLDECVVVELTRPIREIAITVRKTKKLKLPDAVIAATSIHLDFPLVSMDRDFENLEDLNAVIIDL